MKGLVGGPLLVGEGWGPGPLKSSPGSWGSAVRLSSPSGAWGRAPAEIEFGAF